MTKVDFYILNSQELEQRLSFAGRLCHKAISNGHRVLLATDSDSQLEALTQRLDHERPELYLPWRRITDTDMGQPIAVDCTGECGSHHDMLINLCTELPEYFSRFSRMAEISIQTDATLARSRQHWRFLAKRGYPLEHHSIKNP